MAAMSNQARTQSPLQAVVQETFAAPATLAEERRQVALVTAARDAQRGQQNLATRQASRQQNLARYGTREKPPPIQPARMVSLPTLPAAVVLPPIASSNASETNDDIQPPKKVKRKPAPKPHQALAFVAPKAARVRVTNVGKASGVKAKKAPPRKRCAAGPGRRKAPLKKPKPSDRQLAEEEEIDTPSEEDTGLSPKWKRFRSWGADATFCRG